MRKRACKIHTEIGSKAWPRIWTPCRTVLPCPLKYPAVKRGWCSITLIHHHGPNPITSFPNCTFNDATSSSLDGVTPSFRRYRETWLFWSFFSSGSHLQHLTDIPSTTVTYQCLRCDCTWLVAARSRLVAAVLAAMGGSFNRFSFYGMKNTNISLNCQIYYTVITYK